jgi:hypothetical protein
LKPLEKIDIILSTMPSMFHECFAEAHVVGGRIIWIHTFFLSKRAEESFTELSVLKKYGPTIHIEIMTRHTTNF